MWLHLKSRVRRDNTSPSSNAFVMGLIEREVLNIDENSWKHAVSHIMKIEDSYFSAPNMVTLCYIIMWIIQLLTNNSVYLF